MSVSNQTDMNDYTSKEFEEGFEAWCDMQARANNPYEPYSFEWVEWDQGWNEAQGE